MLQETNASMRASIHFELCLIEFNILPFYSSIECGCSLK